MRRTIAIGCALACLTAAAFGQAVVKAKDIKENPEAYLNNPVTVEGTVTQWLEDPAQSSFYYLKDDWGTPIRVRSTQGKPEVTRRYRVSGPVSVDPRNNEVFISEERREKLEKAPPAPAVAQTDVSKEKEKAAAPPPAEDKTSLYLLVGGIALVFVLLVLLVVFILRRNRAAAPAGLLPGEFGGEGLPAPIETIEGKTIKLQVPPPGTLKLLPGRFEVTAGDDKVKEVRFYKPKGRTTAEITFGRARGPAYSHVQLMPMTVSSRQAKVVFDNNGRVYLVNYAGAESNPTRLNGREMGVEESAPLQPEDTVAMGEIEFVYRSN